MINEATKINFEEGSHDNSVILYLAEISMQKTHDYNLPV
jgi:hypothetical protein